MTLSILKLTIFGFTHVKDINLLKELKNCIQEAKDPSQPEIIQFKMENKWLFIDNLKEFIKTVGLEIRVNDNMDVCARIS